MDKKPFKNCLNILKNEYEYPFTETNSSQLISDLCKERFDKISSNKPESLVVLFHNVLNDNGKDQLERLRKIILLECLLDSWDDFFSEKYPESIQGQFEKNFNRFLEICNNREGWTKYQDDVYWKDLSIARQQCIPVGPVIVEIYSGFGLRQGLCVNIFQTLKFLKLLLRTGGRKGYFQTHVHILSLDEFNEKGWFNAYLRIAEMLKKQKHIKGVLGTAWFRDPQLEIISPHLTYLRRLPFENGAQFFYVGKDQSGNAFAKSKKRLKLYNQGKYIPRTYLMVWPRRELIKWADRQTSKQ